MLNKWYLFILMLPCVLQAQSTNHQSALRDADNIRVAVADADEQALRWTAASGRNTKDAHAWLNRFQWQERNSTTTAADLENTVSEAGRYISETYEYALMQFLLSGKTDERAMQRAFSRCTDKAEMYPYMIQHYIIKGDITSAETYCTLLNKSASAASDSASYFYHQNVLMSADSGATVYARGLHDLVPMAVLQQVYHIRKDITLKYYTDSLAAESQKNSYLCLSLGKEVISKYGSEAVYTGLLVRISNTRDASSELLRHYNNDLNIRYLKHYRFYGEQAQINLNYLPSLVQLYRYWQETDTQRAADIRVLILKLAGEGGGTALEKKVETLIAQ